MEEGGMKYWLLKSEPETWSWEMQKKKGAKGEPWSGVRNHTAKQNLMAMKKGDLAFFYHSGDEKAVVGIVEVIGEYRPDPTDEKGIFGLVDVKAVKDMPRPVTLAEAKATPQLAGMSLVKSFRLSVQPVTPQEWKLVCKMGELKS
jgi:predicted RNA-binding protein with PUA-like domain